MGADKYHSQLQKNVSRSAELELYIEYLVDKLME